MPAIFPTDSPLHWEPTDQEVAVLLVPFGDGQQQLIFRFSPENGLPNITGSMRYKRSESDKKIIWINQAQEWRKLGGYLIPNLVAVTWFDEG